jgi:hypothetical protein
MVNRQEVAMRSDRSSNDERVPAAEDAFRGPRPLIRRLRQPSSPLNGGRNFLAPSAAEGITPGR